MSTIGYSTTCNKASCAYHPPHSTLLIPIVVSTTRRGLAFLLCYVVRLAVHLSRKICPHLVVHLSHTICPQLPHKYIHKLEYSHVDIYNILIMLAFKALRQPANHSTTYMSSSAPPPQHTYKSLKYRHWGRHTVMPWTPKILKTGTRPLNYQHYGGTLLGASGENSTFRLLLIRCAKVCLIVQVRQHAPLQGNLQRDGQCTLYQASCACRSSGLAAPA